MALTKMGSPTLAYDIPFLSEVNSVHYFSVFWPREREWSWVYLTRYTVTSYFILLENDILVQS